MDLQQILESLRDIGLSRIEEEMYLITDEPKIPGYLCFPSDLAATNLDTKDSFGQGFHPDRTLARVKAIAEYLERLCLYNPCIENMTLAYRRNDSFIDPSSLFCYSEEQVQNRPEELNHILTQNFRWWPAVNLVDNREYQIPAQSVFLSSLFDDEVPIRKERISTGAALGPIGTQHALKSGLMESIERDACIHSYLTRKPQKEIIGLPDNLDKLVHNFKRYQLEPHIFDASSDLGIPAVIVATLDRTGVGAAVNIGSSASITYEDAIHHALLESIHCRRTSRVMKTFQFPEGLPSASEITSMDNRFYYWHPIDRIDDLSFWLDQTDTIPYHEIIRKDTTLTGTIAKLSGRKFNIYVADITLPEIVKNGFQVLKVIVPELHPLYLDERAKALYSQHYGHIRDDITLKPHPFT